MNHQLTTFGAVCDRVEAMSRNHHDQLISVSDISFESIKTMNVGSQQYRVQPIAQRFICHRLGIPHYYLQKCSDDVQAYNLNHWIPQERNEQLFVRFDGNSVRAMFTPRYTPLDNTVVIQQLDSHGYKPDTEVQCHLDGNMMMLNIPDREEFVIGNNDRMRPGISIGNSEVGLSSLSISAFILRLVCTNGMISRNEEVNSYRHISQKILSEFPEVISRVTAQFGVQQSQLRISMESRVDHPVSTLENFNRQFQLSELERGAVEWAWPFEAGETMFHVVQTYTKAAQAPGLTADNSYRLQRTGGAILAMVN